MPENKTYLHKIMLTIACIMAMTLPVAAQPFSYVYIQGDKTTPFYVKVNGKMLPRYGKNYCIIPELTAGPLHIEVLFQQHAFLPQKFTLQVPEHGSRGFLLNKQEQGFALYDLQTNKYLAGNEEPAKTEPK